MRGQRVGCPLGGERPRRDHGCHALSHSQTPLDALYRHAAADASRRHLGGAAIHRRPVAGGGDLPYARRAVRQPTPRVLLPAVPPKSLCVEPMQALGFKARERITYRINDLSDLNALIGRFSKNKKRQLQKALSLHADYSMSPEDFYRFHAVCMAEQRKAITYSREFFLVLERKLHRLNQCAIIAIKDADNHTHAAAFLAWDSRVMYYLISDYTPEGKVNGARELLKLEAIKAARHQEVCIDFCTPRFGKSFAAEPEKMIALERYSNWILKLLVRILEHAG